MTRNQQSVLRFFSVFMLVILAGFATGCACKSGMTGGHAFAQKAGPAIDEGPEDPFGARPTGEIPITESETFKKYNVCQRIHFDYDKSEIKPEWTECLDNIAQALIQEPDYLLIVEGHCDERGSDEYNMALGERRASSTLQYLVQRGVSENRIQTRSMGESMPLADCSDESCWWQNRRGEFYVVYEAR